MPGNNIPISMVGLNFKTAPIEVREQVERDLDSKMLFQKCAQIETFEGGVLLKTCNRIEFYTDGLADVQDQGAFLSQDIKPDMIYQKGGMEAVGHLFSVASSLDSMVVGEPQILGQVKQAYEYAKKHHFISPLLDQIFQKTFQVSKKIRSETSIGDYSVSLSSIAVDLTKEFFENLENKEVLLIGAGQMAELAAKHFDKNNIAKMWIMNRSYDHAVGLAKRCNGIPLPMDHMIDKIKDIDILMTSTGANQHLLTADQIKPFLEGRKQRPLLCIDISVPRNLDPAIHELDDVYLYGIDDIQNVVDRHVEIRESEAHEAALRIEEELEKFTKSLTLPSISQTAQKLSQKIQPLRDQEIRRLEKVLSLDADQKNILEKALDHFGEKVLLNPIMYVRDAKDEAERKIRMARISEIFFVDEASDDSNTGDK